MANTGEKGRGRVLTLVLTFLIVFNAALTDAFARSDSSANEALRGRYFLVVWAYQGPGNAPKHSHTFAAFYDGDDLADGRVLPATISWLPTSGLPHLLGIEKGRNFTLAQTLALACKTGKQVASMGPYEITFYLYQRALARIRFLRSGTVAYSVLALRSGSMNCIQAAGDITGTAFHPGISYGWAASPVIVRHFSPFFKKGGQINHTLAPVLIAKGCG
jgi:hypothetical protein